MRFKLPHLPPYATPIILLAIATLVGTIFLLIKSRQPGTPGQLAYQSIYPGTTTLDQALTQLGSPISTETQGDATVYKFDSGNIFYPNQVTIREDKVDLINQYLADLPQENQIAKYTQLTGAPPITLYNQDSLMGVNLYVYLPAGIAVKASQTNGLGYHIFYFPPTDLQTFISRYAPDYSTTLDVKKLYRDSHSEATTSSNLQTIGPASPSTQP